VKQDILTRLGSLEYFNGSALPSLGTDFLEIDLSSHEGLSEASRLTGLVFHPFGEANTLLLHRSASPWADGFSVHLHGSRNVLLIDRDVRLAGSCHLVRDDNLAVFFEGAAGRVHCTAEAGSTTLWGREAFGWDTRMAAQGGAVVTIGDRTLMALGVLILASDFHSLVDLETLRQFNFPEDVYLEPDVWLGERCLVMKGLRIGQGSVVAAGSVVTRSVPPRQCWAGNPARCVRENVSWVRSHPATEEDLAALGLRLSDKDLKSQ
jgi:hypothetical protein